MSAATMSAASSLFRLSAPAILRRTLVSRATTPSAASAVGHGVRMHQPLGVPPDGTSPEEVRAKWGSNAMDLIQSAEPIKVKGPVAICDGGGGPLGHPIEYIQLNRADSEFPAVCKYCGTKFISVD